MKEQNVRFIIIINIHCNLLNVLAVKTAWRGYRLFHISAHTLSKAAVCLWHRVQKRRAEEPPTKSGYTLLQRLNFSQQPFAVFFKKGRNVTRKYILKINTIFSPTFLDFIIDELSTKINITIIYIMFSIHFL